MATHSSILAQEIPWTEEPGGLQSMDCKELDTTITMDDLIFPKLLTLSNRHNMSVTYKDSTGQQTHEPGTVDPMNMMTFNFIFLKRIKVKINCIGL